MSVIAEVAGPSGAVSVAEKSAWIYSPPGLRPHERLPGDESGLVIAVHEVGISRQCLSKWVNRYRRLGEEGLFDASSAPGQPHEDITPGHRPHRTPAAGERMVGRTIAAELAGEGVKFSVSTVGRWLVRLGISRRRDLDPAGASNRQPARKIVARYPGHMIHVDVKKAGRIPDGGGWRAHGKASAQARATRRAAARAHTTSANKGVWTGYVFLHSAVDGSSRLVCTEHLPDEKAVTAIGFMARARAFFADHSITRIAQVVTDNGSAYRSRVFLRALNSLGVSVHQRIRPFTPQHNGKVERYNRILAEEFLYARTWTSETQRAQALQAWIVHYNYHRAHTSAGTSHRPSDYEPASPTS